MSDNYDAVRSLPFATFAAELGIHIGDFKRDNRKRDWVGLCPIHGSKNNKGCFRYNDDGRFHCFSCNARGSGAIDLTKETLKIGFREAVERLGSITSVPVETPRVSDSGAPGAILKPLKPGAYSKFFVKPCPWLEARGITEETAEVYRCGWYVNNSRKSAFAGRYMIPFRGFEDGEIYGYMGRYIGDDPNQPKYLVPNGFPKSDYLFGAYELKQKQLPVKVLFVVESPWTVMKFRQYGIHAISAYGWSVSDSQLRVLQELTRAVLYLPDRNKMEDSKHIASILANSLWVKVPELPLGIDDPEYLSAEQIRSLL